MSIKDPQTVDAMKAMKATVKLAFDRGMPDAPKGPVSYQHIAGMLQRMDESDFSYGKQCRWLGWAQCAVVASGIATLDNMKAINKLHAD